jgi:ligand-binding SRPBCC domain-containing protein
MTSAITSYEYPGRFVGEQQRGPFRRWWHEHMFVAMADSRTQTIDIVEFRAPPGPVGSLAGHLVLDNYMLHLLCQRSTWLKTTLEARR